MRTRLALLLVLAVTAALPASAGATTLLRLNGIGPLHLHDSLPTALASGWLSNRSTGCKLGGPPYPITYGLKGDAAPAGIGGSVEFDSGVLASMTFTSGVRTSAGVRPGVSTVRQMLQRYRAAGYVASAKYDTTFAGTFVHVRRHRGGRQVLGGFATKGVIRQLGLPFVPVCE